MVTKKRRSYQLAKEAFLATAVFGIVVFLVSLVPLKFEFIRPIKQELDDFDIYDLFFTGKTAKNPGTKDTDIYLVQAADTRSEIARQINEINSLHPAVIGIDLSFPEKKDDFGDSLLTLAILNRPNIVAGYTINTDDQEGNLIKENFLPRDFLYKNGGYINFAETDSVSVIRAFAPIYCKDGKSYTSFAKKVADRYSRKKTQGGCKNADIIETINYRGNIGNYNNFSALQFEELFKTKQLDSFKNKIVLLGFFTKNDGSPPIMDDMRFSPLNKKLSGRSFPDVYGVVIHANIVSMILNGNDYIIVPPAWVSYLISFIVSFFVLYYILYLHKKYEHPIHLRFILVQVVAIVFLTYLFLKLFDWFNVKVTLTPMVLMIVLSIEMFDLYKLLAVYLNKLLAYKTIFSHHQK